jgi:DNA polymerase delta subunit 2
MQVRHVKAEPTFSRPPIEKLSDCLLDIAGSMPLHILPGSTDPTGTILPQQALPRAMLGPISGMSTFRSETNPALLRISSGHEGTTQRTSDLLVTSGQTIDDMFKYVKTPPVTRLNLAEGTLQWRHLAPTAPDTLWCHPYFTKDPFILENTPHAYVIGNQPEYATKLIHTRTDGDQNVQCRIILVPRFSQTGLLVLFNPVTLAVRTIRLSIPARI